MLQKLTVFSLLFISSTAWAEGTTSFTTGFDYSTGKYGGSTTTNILYIPVIAKYQTDDYFLKLTIPYISVSSVGGVTIGTGPFKKVTATKVVTQSGLGDVVATAGYTIYGDDLLLIGLVGNIKFGTADANKNLGTGENDYSAQLDGFYSINETTLLATAGYKIFGAPAGVTLNNIIYGSIGFSQKTSKKTSVGVILDVAQASSDISPGARELSFFVSNKISKTTKIQLNLLKGLSDSSPDYGIGIMFTGAI